MSKQHNFESPDAVRLSFSENNISIHYAHTKKPSGDITESDILEELTVSFAPQEFVTAIALMVSALYQYQKKYDVDLGVSFNVEEEQTDNGDNGEENSN